MRSPAARQDSNSGATCNSRPVRSNPSLTSISPCAVATVSIRRSNLRRRFSLSLTPKALVSRKISLRHAGDRRRFAKHGQQRSRPIFLHLRGEQKHVERTGGKQPIHHRAGDFGRKVVEVGLDLRDRVGREEFGRIIHAIILRRVRRPPRAGRWDGSPDPGCPRRSRCARSGGGASGRTPARIPRRWPRPSA